MASAGLYATEVHAAPTRAPSDYHAKGPCEEVDGAPLSPVRPGVGLVEFTSVGSGVHVRSHPYYDQVLIDFGREEGLCGACGEQALVIYFYYSNMAYWKNAILELCCPACGKFTLVDYRD